MPWIKSDKAQLKRFTSSKEFLFDKIAQLECKLGAYKMSGKDVPNEALAVYVSTNPRNLWKAVPKGLVKLATLIQCDGRTSNPHQEIMSVIQQTASKRTYLTFDLDKKCSEILNECKRIVNNVCRVMETRGGYHIFVPHERIKDIERKLWYNEMKKYCDQAGDMMSPPVGTLQGGHLVKWAE